MIPLFISQCLLYIPIFLRMLFKLTYRRSLQSKEERLMRQSCQSVLWRYVVILSTCIFSPWPSIIAQSVGEFLKEFNIKDSLKMDSPSRPNVSVRSNIIGSQRYWVFGLCPSSEFEITKNTTFRKLDLFTSSGEGRHLHCWVPYKELSSITG
jgi:hypothetical protein